MSTVLYAATTGSLDTIGDAADPEYCNRATRLSGQNDLQANTSETKLTQSLDLCKTRTYDCALTMLGAHKLTGNFPTELEIVLRDLGVLDEVTYEIAPKEFRSLLSSVRHVVFRANANVCDEKFQEIMHLIHSRIGASATAPWWVRLFRQAKREVFDGSAAARTNRQLGIRKG